MGSAKRTIIKPPIYRKFNQVKFFLNDLCYLREIEKHILSDNGKQTSYLKALQGHRRREITGSGPAWIHSGVFTTCGVRGVG